MKIWLEAINRLTAGRERVAASARTPVCAVDLIRTTRYSRVIRRNPPPGIGGIISAPHTIHDAKKSPKCKIIVAI